MKQIYSSFNLGSLQVQYILDTDSRIMGLRIMPQGFWNNELSLHRKDISSQPENHFFGNWGDFPDSWLVEPLVLFSCTDSERAGGYSQGLTLRNGSRARSIQFHSQIIEENDRNTIIDTSMKSTDGILIVHRLEYLEGTEYLTCSSKLVNEGTRDIQLELLSSFTMGFINPLQIDDAPGKYRIHRFRSSWSGEGRHLCESAESLELENSWCNVSANSERFGQLGSMPVRRWFPTVGIEDTEYGIIWGARIEAPGSWQMEIYRMDDFFHLSGGLADWEFGHWKKIIAPGRMFQTGEAVITAVSGGIEDLCVVITDQQKTDKQIHSPIFNEWCTNWGKPSAAKIMPLLDIARDLGMKYFVIDAGWYADGGGNWETTQGEWNVSEELFPAGLKNLCEKIRGYGMIPGLWFEPEVVGEDSRLRTKTEWFLHRDGIPIKSGSRFFLDFRNEEVRDYLESKIGNLIRDCGIGYVKFDYNETIGAGCDGNDSYGEGLNVHLAEVQSFYRKLKIDFPELVVENCSSGGLRLEPSFINQTDLSSFSDAHETQSVPIIAANLQLQLHPSKSLIWAVIHPSDNPDRLYYSLASTFLGLQCLSGEIAELSKYQLAVIKGSVDLHKTIAPILHQGKSRRYGPQMASYRKPLGWQAVVRYSPDYNEVIIVIHTFEDSPLSILLPFDKAEDYSLQTALDYNKREPILNNNSLVIENLSDFTGIVLYLKRTKMEAGG